MVEVVPVIHRHWKRKHTLVSVHLQIQACHTNSCVDTDLLPFRHKSCMGQDLRGVSSLEAKTKIVPTLTVVRPKRGITRYVAAVETSSRQSNASGDTDAVRRSDVGEDIHDDQELELLPLATEIHADKKACDYWWLRLFGLHPTTDVGRASMFDHTCSR